MCNSKRNKVLGASLFHDGMARPQVADGGDGCEYIEYVLADSRQGVIVQFWGLGVD
jgi:hypothetical protein